MTRRGRTSLMGNAGGEARGDIMDRVDGVDEADSVESVDCPGRGGTVHPVHVHSPGAP